jgi:pyruvate/2-oxoglutarate dehydrogenase complex dihydrolipoamide dehydrogenase (E3) component
MSTRTRCATRRYDNIWALGDVMNAPNAKTAAAARMQAPVVAENVLDDIAARWPRPTTTATAPAR